MQFISYFMPAYNCAATVEESILSIINGNFDPKGDELIVVNDCSTDNTLEILNKIHSAHPFIKIISHKRNKGGAAARNTAIENAGNELVFCLDSDNVLDKNSVQKLKEKLVAEKADIACFNEVRYFKGNTSELSHSWFYPLQVIDAAYCLSHTQIPPASGNYLFTKTSWLKAGGYPEFSGALDTWGFGVRQLFTGSKMVICKDTFYFHRVGYESYWVRDSKARKLSLTCLQILIPYFDRIADESIDHMMSKRHRYNWFDHIEKNPIRVVDKKEPDNSLLGKIKNKLR